MSERKEEDARDETLVTPLRQAAGALPLVATQLGPRFARAEARQRAQA